jgi:hypothetical protein
MTGQGIQSPEVVRFLTLFQQVKTACDDTPERIKDLVETEAAVARLCSEFWVAAQTLRESEVKSATAFATGVGQTFVLAWRDYECRYLRTLFLALMGSGEEVFTSAEDHSYIIGDRGPWMVAQAMGALRAFDIRLLQSILDKNRTALNEVLSAFFEEFIHEGEQGSPRTADDILESLKFFLEIQGFDVAYTVRRRLLLPFILAPHSVSRTRNERGRISLLRNLQDAQKAFVFGATHAAIGLMRSILEAVLRDHYVRPGTPGLRLEELIDQANSLPPSVNPRQLHNFRKMANSVLHLGAGPAIGMTDYTDEQIEGNIVRYFALLRLLIENVEAES